MLLVRGGNTAVLFLRVCTFCASYTTAKRCAFFATAKSGTGVERPIGCICDGPVKKKHKSFNGGVFGVPAIGSCLYGVLLFTVCGVLFFFLLS